MGRPKGEGGRSKSRPSSSSLAASLLPSGSVATAGFGGYVGGSRIETSLAREESAPFLDIDSEVAQHLKRLARKDPVTKLKALQSLSLLFKEKPAKDIVLIIPQWAFEYRRLLLDYNRDVRRATHETMTNLVMSVGRDLAPHLKSLMGPWWFTQFDPVSEIALVAKQSLQAAFPSQEKRLDALILCASEIFVYLEENLKLTPEGMSDKTAPSDELEEMHRQVISSSLLALSTLLDVLIQPQRPGFDKIAAEPKNASKARTTAVSFAEKLFSSPKYFIDFLKSQSRAIRSATFSVLKSFIKSIPHAFDEGTIKIVATAVLGAFQEKDPACHSSMWEAVLLFSKQFPESWNLLNVQKVVLGRLWNFLKNGCFGSQQISYPALILFLNIIPPKTVAVEKFFHDFFHNLWEGRNLAYSASADYLALFQAFKECFLWGLRNASRYFDDLDSIHQFQFTLVQSILVKLLWKEYLFSIYLRNSEKEPFETSGDYSNYRLQQKTVTSMNVKYSMGFVQELGKCIIGMLSGINSIDINLLSNVCVAFKDDIVGFFQQSENSERSTEIEQLIRLLPLLEQHAAQTGEMWPVDYLIGPVLAESFPLIRSTDNPDGVRLLSVAVTLFGARKIVHNLSISNEEHPFSLPKNGDKELNAENFSQVFKQTFVPWCLIGYNCSTSSRLDLLLALLDDDECFAEQWCTVISFATAQESSRGQDESREFDHLIPLAMLLEKVRVEINRRKVTKDSNGEHWSNAEHWHCQPLETVSIACLSFPSRTAAQLLCAVFGDSKEGDQFSFVSRKTTVLIFKEVFKMLLGFIYESSLSSVRDSGSLLFDGPSPFTANSNSSVTIAEMAQFALEVLGRSIFSLNTLSEDTVLVSGILASVFIIDWEYSMTTIDNMLDEESEGQVKGRLNFGESLHGFRCTITEEFWKGLNIENRKRLGSILVNFIRSVIFKDPKLNANKITVLCCSWMLDILACLCHDQNEEQNLLDRLLSKDDGWPSWIVPDFNTLNSSATIFSEDVSVAGCASGNLKLVSVIDKLISKIGIERIIAGIAEQGASLPDDLTNEIFSSRPWLAAEILCSWKWPGGSAIGSFLPQLVVFAKKEIYSFKESFLDSVFNILLNGALVHGECNTRSPFVLCPALGEGLESIEDPFLRGLLSLLITLLKDNIWDAVKAEEIFKMLTDKLYIGEAISQNCLRILPPIIYILVQTICQKSSTSGESTVDRELDYLGGNLIQDTVERWLQRILSFPPLVIWQAGQEMEEWFWLVATCYPMSASSGTRSVKLERSISHEEKELILELFRKQRQIACASVTTSQLMLSKLMVISVGYCWKEFVEEDWEFFFAQSRSWIQSTVVVMEEFTENVNDTISSSSASGSFEIHKILEQNVLTSDLSVLVAINALVSFSSLSGVMGFEESAVIDVAPQGRGRWDSTRDRILEGILRLFFCTGIAEAIASSYGHEAASLVATSRLDNQYFWELVASHVIQSPPRCRDRAIKSVEFWGLSKGATSSLYAVLFSSVPIPSLQFAAYVILSSEPFSQWAIFEEEATGSLNNNSRGDKETCDLELPSEKNVHLKEELLGMIEKLPHEILEMDFVAREQVNVFLAWSLLLSHLWSLPSLSPERERLVQYVQDSTGPLILDCILQHIPLESCMVHVSKKKDMALLDGVPEAASAATRAIKTGSLLFAVESLWPIDLQKMSSLAGALFGLMLQVLPAYVREWFTEIRDRSKSSQIESFTRMWCSPPLIVNELSQIKNANFADENFSVSVSKSANEVVATYMKDETGMDLVIRLPVSYPLRAVDVECMRSLGISEVKQRKWLMSMMMFVRNQNGALAEAIRIWKSNFDKEFEGVEECPICYSVIHTSNHSLPRLACRTCKHKFHSACLYKWFSTSHKSSCPLCQSPF
ncbi:hypothetical protein K2173_016502 [Erythroxylum novogranatense]|uniref:E3 ubiquitin-protein ligase listerin n=1 Tax=Erythroxylum novogranatense TaxID=1862640 RepID=A0AAV8SGN2_9ROSI|nr:hypothetical protein K2173_016502 [Erythroxylum novogranatense]